MKDPGCRSSRGEPYILFSLGHEARATCGERAFAINGTGQRLGRNVGPCFSAIIGRDQLEMAVHRIAHGNSVIAIPESHAVKETFWIFVSELQQPVFATINSLVNARLLAWACREQISDTCAECFDIPEVEG